MFTLIAQTQGFNMECEFGTSKGWQYVSSNQQCKVKNLILTTRGETVTSINGNDASHYQADNIKILRIESQTMHFFPNGIGSFFKNLEGIYVEKCNLKSIRSSDLEPFKELKELWIKTNDLEVLENDLLQYNPELRMVTFEQNKLKYIGENLLEKSAKLEKVYFTSGSCTSKNTLEKSRIHEYKNEFRSKCPMTLEYYNDDNGNPKLMKDEIAELKSKLILVKSKLKVCDGTIDAMSMNFFLTSKKLETCMNPDIVVIDKDFNSKVNISCDSKNDEICNVLELKVELPMSPIEQITDEEGNILMTEKITKLSISDQQMIFLPSKLSEHFSNLRDLSINSSGLLEIHQEDFIGLTSLSTLAITYNKIREIPCDAFKQLEALSNLDLSFNKIEHITDCSMAGLEKLEILNLRNNLLIALNRKVFDGLKSLKELSLQNNKLKLIAANFLSEREQLVYLNLSNNECIDAVYPNQTLNEIKALVIEECSDPIELNCRFAEENINLSEMKVISGYTCNIEADLIIDYPNSNIVAVRSNHTINNSLNNVSVFFAENLSMKFMPLELSKFFPQLEAISIIECKLSLITSKDFKGFSQLNTIVIRNNNLQIGESTFDEAVYVEYLDLSFNQIKILPSKIFAKLLRLKTLILSSNSLVNLSFDILPRRNVIEEFHIDNNKLDMIDSILLKFLRKAKLVKMHGNECIGLNYVASEGNSITFNEFYQEINVNCCLNYC